MLDAAIACIHLYQSQGQSLQLPPSLRFPPLREGNRAWVRFPLLAGGTLRRGLSGILVFVNFGCAIGITIHARASRVGGLGKMHTKVVPCPCSERTSIVPLCFCIALCASISPIPLPFGRVVTARSNK